MIINIDKKTNEILGVYTSVPENIREDYIDSYIEVENTDINFLNGKYFYIDKDIKFIPYNFNLIKSEFDYKAMEYIEKASLDEQIEHYKNLIIKKTREHELLKASGFTGTQEEINLKTEIEDLKQIYMDKNHELALQIENRLK